jgi:hypothetical protein
MKSANNSVRPRGKQLLWGLSFLAGEPGVGEAINNGTTITTVNFFTNALLS